MLRQGKKCFQMTMPLKTGQPVSFTMLLYTEEADGRGISHCEYAAEIGQKIVDRFEKTGKWDYYIGMPE